MLDMGKKAANKSGSAARSGATSSALSRLRALASSQKPTAKPAKSKSAAKAKAPKKPKAKADVKPKAPPVPAKKAPAKAAAAPKPEAPSKPTAPPKPAAAKKPAVTAKTKRSTKPTAAPGKPTAAPSKPTAAPSEHSLLPAEPEKSKRPVLPRVKDMLLRVPSEHVQPPLQPVPHMLSEAHALFAVAKRYADKLSKIGFSEPMLDGLSLYAQALEEAQDDLDAHRGKQYAAAELKLVNQASELRNQILLGARLALRKDRKVLESLDAIVESEGAGDLARDLLDLALIAESYPAQLSRLGLGMETAYKARELSRKLSTRPSPAKVPTADERTMEDLRDRAATVLHELMTEARLGGAYVFRKEPKLALLFTATHRRGSR